jgi:hypothetical protein
MLAHNGLRIGDSGGLENLNFQFYTKLSNSLLLFSKFKKKGNIKGCCDKKGETFNFSLIPPFRQYDVSRRSFISSLMLAQLFRYSVYFLREVYLFS